MYHTPPTGFGVVALRRGAGRVLIGATQYTTFARSSARFPTTTVHPSPGTSWGPPGISVNLSGAFVRAGTEVLTGSPLAPSCGHSWLMNVKYVLQSIQMVENRRKFSCSFDFGVLYDFGVAEHEYQVCQQKFCLETRFFAKSVKNPTFFDWFRK